MKRQRVLRQLEKALGQTFVAGGRFSPRGVIAGLLLGGPLGSVFAARFGQQIARRKGGLELPRMVYVALTEDDVSLVQGRYGWTVRPTDRVLATWPRSAVRATRKSGLRSIRLELAVEGIEQPVRLLCDRADSSAKEVVRLLAG